MAATEFQDRRTSIPAVHADDLFVVAGAAVSSLCLTWLVYWQLTPEPGILGFVLAWFAAFGAMYWLATRRMLGRLFAEDRLIAVMITAGAVVMLGPLALVVGFVAYKGFSVITPHFFTETAQFCGQLDAATCGGVGHAIVGTLEQVGIATLMAVPLAVLCAVFLNEIGGPFKRPVRLFVDAMSGVPSIVAGLFIYAVWVVGFQQGFSGIAASFALAILMLPTITRTSEEVLRLVPDGLREGSLALGGTEWRTVWQVVLPTARSGLITAVILGVARAVGETAPLLLTAFGSSVINANPLNGPQEALPHYVYQYIRFNPGTGPHERAWAAAAVLTGMVLGLFTTARLVGALTSIEARQKRAGRAARRAAAPPRARVKPAVAAVATAIVAAVALVLYVGGGLVYANATLTGAQDAYSSAADHRQQVSDAVQALSKLLQVSSTDVKVQKASAADFVKQTQDARDLVLSDDAALADADSSLRQLGWLTVIRKFAIDQEASRIGHVRLALSEARTITADYLELAAFILAKWDVDGDVLALGNVKAGDLQGGEAALTRLKADLEKAIPLDKAPGVLPVADTYLTDLQAVATDLGNVIKAAKAGDQSGADAANKALAADTAKVDKFDKTNLVSDAFYLPLIGRYELEMARARAS
jgi:phosphate transport system permease protein